jgi:hypothetical protein
VCGAQNVAGRRETNIMEEKVYKTMSGAGVLNIVMGVLALVAGVAGGVLLLISGAKLVSGKSKILF